MTKFPQKWPWATPPVGVYFNMSFDEYLKIPCLNASGIKELNISETDFWSRSWMNPDYDDIDDDSKAKIEGRAYHKRILEGRERFFSEYALEYEDDGNPMVLRSAKEIKEKLDRIGIVCQVLFGFVPDDLKINFNSLRILNSVEEEQVKNHRYNRVMSAYQSGLVTPQEAKEAINKDSLLPIEIDELTDALPPIEGNFTTGGDSVTE